MSYSATTTPRNKYTTDQTVILQNDDSTRTIPETDLSEQSSSESSSNFNQNVPTSACLTPIVNRKNFTKNNSNYLLNTHKSPTDGFNKLKMTVQNEWIKNGWKKQNRLKIEKKLAKSGLRSVCGPQYVFANLRKRTCHKFSDKFHFYDFSVFLITSSLEIYETAVRSYKNLRRPQKSKVQTRRKNALRYPRRHPPSPSTPCNHRHTSVPTSSSHKTTGNGIFRVRHSNAHTIRALYWSVVSCWETCE